MSAKEALISTFSRLKQSKINKIPIIIETNHTSIKSLIAVLEANKPIIVVKKYKNSYAVRVSTTVSSIEVLPQFVHTKNNQLQDWAKKMLAEKSGCLVLSTSRGIMSHHEATSKHLGGQILGFAY